MTNGYPKRYNSAVLDRLSEKVAPQGWPTRTEWTAQQGAFGWPQPDRHIPALPLLKEADLWLDAALSPRRDKRLINLGMAGSELDAIFGISIATGTDEPVDLPWSATNYIYLPGIAGNSISCTAPAGTASYAAYPVSGDVAVTGAAAPGAFTLETAGNWRQVDLLNGSATVIASFLASSLTEVSTSFVDSFAITWSLNRTTSGRKLSVVTRSKLLFGTDDYLRIKHWRKFDFGARDSFTVAGCMRVWNNAPGTVTPFIGQRSSTTGAGWLLRCNTGGFAPAMVINDLAGNSAIPAGAALTAGTLHFVYGVVNRSAQTVTVGSGNGNASLSATSVGSVDTVPTAVPIDIGRNGSNYAAMEWFGTNIWRRVLSETELAIIASYYNAS